LTSSKPCLTSSRRTAKSSSRYWWQAHCYDDRSWQKQFPHHWCLITQGCIPETTSTFPSLDSGIRGFRKRMKYDGVMINVNIHGRCDSRNYMTDRIISFWVHTRRRNQKFQGSRREGHNRDHFEYVLEALCISGGRSSQHRVGQGQEQENIHEPITAAHYRDMNLFIPPMRSI
jgi:hypothetical protein